MPNTPLTASPVAAPGKGFTAGGTIPLGDGVPGLLGDPEAETWPPTGPPAGAMEPVLLVLAAASLNAARLFGPEVGGLMTATMPAAQWGRGAFWGQYSQVGFSSLTVMVKVWFCSSTLDDGFSWERVWQDVLQDLEESR